jgi:hypothetical protein
MASVSFSTHTKQSIAEAAQRSLNGTVNDNLLRVLNPSDAPISETLSPQGMMKMCEDLYCRKVLEIKAKQHLPMRVASWKRACAEFQTFLLMRLGTNWERLCAHPADQVAVAVMPFSVFCPHPSKAQADAWQKQWDDDGNLYRYVSSKCPNVLCFPVLLYEGTNDKSHVQFSVVIIRPPTSL